MRREKVKKFLSDEHSMLIRDVISRMEARTSGEIRVMILRDVPGDIMSRAREEFLKLGMKKTRDATGVLILVALVQRTFAIFADDGINAKIPQERWQAMAERLGAHFAQGHYAIGLIGAVKACGELLAEHFPRHPDDVDELSNEPLAEDG